MLQRQVRTVQTARQNVEIPLVQFFGVVVLRLVPMVQTGQLVFGGRRSCEHAVTSTGSSRLQAVQTTVDFPQVCKFCMVVDVAALMQKRPEFPAVFSSWRCLRPVHRQGVDGLRSGFCSFFAAFFGTPSGWTLSARWSLIDSEGGFF